MRKFIIPGLLAMALTGASTIAIAQTSGTTPSAQPSGTTATTTTTTVETKKVSAVEAEKWVGKRIHSQDGNDIGEIAAFKAGTDGNVEYFHADIGGFLGIGETSVQVKPSDFSMNGDNLQLDMTKDEALKLPRVTAQ